MSDIQAHWIYYNLVEDKKEKHKETNSIIEELNWRLKPDVASELEKLKNKELERKNNPMQEEVAKFLENSIFKE